MKQGYAHPTYAASLSEFGTPRYLSESDSWILERSIPGVSYLDAIGCYPLFTCSNWLQLASDLNKITDLVSLGVVADPFGDHSPELLEASFPDVCIPFKEHYIIDLEKVPAEYVASHHRRNARKGLRNVIVEECINAGAYLEDWMRLYDVLIQRHHISGIATFSENAFRQQLEIPGMVVFRAVHEGRTVGMLLWCIKEDVAYYHLGAYDEIGYAQKASFALFWHSIEYFADHGLRWLNLGAGAGINANTSDGLSRFKEGWASGTRTAYFCGRIFNKKRYDALSQCAPRSKNNFFPVYRSR